MKLISPATRQTLHSHHPEAAAEIENLEHVLDEDTVDTRVIALCADFFEATLREQDWQRPPSTGEFEAACLDVCEQFAASVSAIDDNLIAPLRRHLSADDIYKLMSSIYLVEMSKRLDITLERVLS